MKPEGHQILESMVDGELKLALIEIIDEILAQDNARTKAGQVEKLATHNIKVATDKTDLDVRNIKHADISDISQFGENSENTAMPSTDMYGQSFWPAAESKPSDAVIGAEKYLEAAGIKGNERPTVTSPKPVVKNVHFERKSLNPDQAAIDKSGDKFVSSNDEIIGSNFKVFLTPDQERKLILILTKMFDAEFRKGNYPFKQVARHVLELLGEKFGSDVADQISIEHLHGSYIGMSARYKDQGADQACDVIAIKNKNELGKENVVTERCSTYLKCVNQDSKVAYFIGEGSIQDRQNGVSSNDGISGKDAVACDGNNVLSINAEASNLSPSSAGSNVYQLSGRAVLDETSINSDSATVTKILAEGTAKKNQAETENVHDVITVAQNQDIIQLLSTCKLIALDRIVAARARIKSRLGTLNSKPDAELFIDGATMAVAYIEAGMHKYSVYTQAMINDFGNEIEPYLRDCYNGACYYLGLDCQTTGKTFQIRGGNSVQ
jgi:hypothetical protein